jgi:hypothetical protein
VTGLPPTSLTHCCPEESLAQIAQDSLTAKGAGLPGFSEVLKSQKFKACSLKTGKKPKNKSEIQVQVLPQPPLYSQVNHCFS